MLYFGAAVAHEIVSIETADLYRRFPLRKLSLNHMLAGQDHATIGEAQMHPRIICARVEKKRLFLQMLAGAARSWRSRRQWELVSLSGFALVISPIVFRVGFFSFSIAVNARRKQILPVRCEPKIAWWHHFIFII